MDILEVIGGNVQAAGSLAGKASALTGVTLRATSGQVVTATIRKQEASDNVLTLGVGIAPTEQVLDLITVELNTALGLYASVSLSPSIKTSQTDVVLFEQTFIFNSYVGESLPPYLPPQNVQIPQIHIDSLPQPSDADAVMLVTGLLTGEHTKSELATKEQHAWVFPSLQRLGLATVKQATGGTFTSDFEVYDGEVIVLSVVSGKGRGYARNAVFAWERNEYHIIGSSLELDESSVLAVYRHVENMLPPAPNDPSAVLVAGNAANYTQAPHRLELRWIKFAVPAGEYAVRIPGYSVMRSDSYRAAHLVWCPRQLAANQFSVRQDWLVLAQPLTASTQVTMLVFEQVAGTGYQVVSASVETGGEVTPVAGATLDNVRVFSTDGLPLSNAVEFDQDANLFMVADPPAKFVFAQVHSIDAPAARYDVDLHITTPGGALATPLADAAWACNQNGLVPLNLVYASGGYMLPAGDFVSLYTIRQRPTVTAPPRNYHWSSAVGEFQCSVSAKVQREHLANKAWLNTAADKAWVFYEGLLAKPGDYIFLPGVGLQVLRAGDWTVVFFTVAEGAQATTNCTLTQRSWPWDNKQFAVGEQELLFAGGLLWPDAALQAKPDVPLDTPLTLVSFQNAPSEGVSTALVSQSSTGPELSISVEGALSPLVFVDRLFWHSPALHSWNGQTLVYTDEPANLTLLGFETGKLSRFKKR